MMKILLESSAPPPPKVVAVMGALDVGFYFRGIGDQIFYFDPAGEIVRGSAYESLDAILSENGGRRPVYEGDRIVLQF